MSNSTASAQSLTSAVAALMPDLKADLARLVAIPSVSAPGYPEATRPRLLEAHEEIVGLCRAAGVQNIASLELPDTAPVITGEIPRPGRGADGAAVRPLRRRRCG